MSQWLVMMVDSVVIASAQLAA